MGAIKESFKIILSGDKEKSRLASRQIRKILYSSKGDKYLYIDIRNIINGAFGEYYKIQETWRQENFVMALSVIYFLRDRNNSPDFLFSWLLQLLQHNNGYIRHAAVKMITEELGPLTVHIRFPDDKMFSKEIFNSEKADEILFSLFMSLCNLSGSLYTPKYKKYKYVYSLPASPYKSVQMVLAEMEYICGAGYLDEFTKLI
ncbi:MAG TPA: hypothetical protein PKY61_01060 [bacterium]|nr:hypothetical protein [bacterium]HQL34513.1 hypothetical protein [bacterium]